MRRSFRRFVAGAWKTIEPGVEFTPGWHIDTICDHLQAVANGQIRNLLINMPPRHMKSSLVSVLFPAWVWTGKPSSQWITGSYAMGLALRDSVAERRLIQSAWYRERFGDVFQLAGDQNAKGRFDNTARGRRLAVSVGGLGTGEGGDFILCDDPHNVTEGESDAARAAAVSWWSQSMSTRGNNSKTVAYVVVGQRVHRKDLSQWCLDSGEYVHLSLPAEYRPKYHCATSLPWQDPRKKEGELLWPERFPRVEINKLKKRLGSYGAAGQLDQHPAPMEGGLFKRSYWVRWRRKGRPFEPSAPTVLLPERFSYTILSVDCAFKDKVENDWVVIQAWGVVGPKKYLLYQLRDHMNLARTIHAIKDVRGLHSGVTAILIEDKANGTAVVETLKHELAGVIPIEPEGGKTARAEAASPYVEAGDIIIPEAHAAGWVGAFIDEHADFPNADHDDQVDAQTQATIWLNRNVALPESDKLKELRAPRRA